LAVALSGEVGDHPFAPLRQLGVAGLHFHHHAAVDAAEADHHEGGEKIERDALGRASVHARRPGDRLGTRWQENRVIGIGEQRGAGIVGDADGQRAALACLAQTGQGKRRRSAGGGRDQHIGGRNAMLLHELGRARYVVLGAFDRLRHRPIAAG